MYEYLIYDQLKTYAKAKKSFHIPGHKARGEFKKKFPVADLDVTELSYSDNLFCPEGVIARAQNEIAGILGARKSYIVTDGSTAGVLAMMFVCAKHGSKIIVPRNSHRSVWNACKIFGLEPVIVQGQSREGVLLPPRPELIENLLENDIEISGMIVASPDYYGNVAPLSAYSAILRKHKRLFAVDGAHGAHLAFEPKRGGYAGVYADMWVDGAHKTLPTLTQGAIVSANNPYIIGDLEEGLSIFRTTSPSYPVMASVEFGVKFTADNTKYTDAAKLALQEFRAKNGYLTFYKNDDWTKLVIDFKPLNISADKAAAVLEKHGVYAELSDGRYIIFYLSQMTAAADLNLLSRSLAQVCHDKKIKDSYREKSPIPANERTYSYQYALKHPCEAVPVSKSAGRMCARDCGLTPPCIPVIVAGEIITEAQISVLKNAKNTFGLYDGKIWVVKK